LGHHDDIEDSHDAGVDQLRNGRGDLPVESTPGKRDHCDLDRTYWLIGHGATPLDARIISVGWDEKAPTPRSVSHTADTVSRWRPHSSPVQPTSCFASPAARTPRFAPGNSRRSTRCTRG